jgi:hypothetical protein
LETIGIALLDLHVLPLWDRVDRVNTSRSDFGAVASPMRRDVAHRETPLHPLREAPTPVDPVADTPRYTLFLRSRLKADSKPNMARSVPNGRAAEPPGKRVLTAWNGQRAGGIGIRCRKHTEVWCSGIKPPHHDHSRGTHTHTPYTFLLSHSRIVAEGRPLSCSLLTFDTTCF